MASPEGEGLNTQRQFVLALHTFTASQQMQLSMNAGEVIEVVAIDDSGWWYGQNLRGDEGYFPSNFVAPITLNEEGSSQSPPTGQPGEGGGGGGGGASSAEVERLRADLAAKDAQLKRMMESQGDSGKQGEAIRAIQEQMSRELEQTKAKAAAEERKCQSLEGQLDAMRQEADQMRALVDRAKSQGVSDSVKRSIVGMKQRHSALVGAFRELKSLVSQEQSSLGQSMMSSVQHFADSMLRRMIDLTQRLTAEEAERRKLHNDIMELKGNIRVLCRIRPLGAAGRETRSVVSVVNESQLTLDDEDRGKKHRFSFAQVFPPGTSQEEVFDAVKAVATSVLDGYNVCIFAYGQTGAGKTFTMEGAPGHEGVNQRTCLELFRLAREKQGSWRYTFTVSVMEIYCDKIFDLLRQRPREKDMAIQVTREGVGVPELTREIVSDPESVLEILSRGNKNRSSGVTDMNHQSSRSHLILQVEVEAVNVDADLQMRSKLNLVDLAGSERVDRSGAQGQAMKEAQSINKSLSTLGTVMQNLGAKSSHVPYRDSKLTHVLQDSLSGQSKVNMFLNISPAFENLSETFSGLNFAVRVADVELGRAKKNMGSASGSGAR